VGERRGRGVKSQAGISELIAQRVLFFISGEREKRSFRNNVTWGKGGERRFFVLAHMKGHLCGKESRDRLGVEKEEGRRIPILSELEEKPSPWGGEVSTRSGLKGEKDLV